MHEFFLYIANFIKKKILCAKNSSADNEGFKNLIIEDNEQKIDPHMFVREVEHMHSKEDAFAINTVTL